MGDSVRGVPGSAHLAAASCALGRARPPPARNRDWVAPARRGQAPEAARRSQELTCRRYLAASACQSNAPSATPRRVLGPGRPCPAFSSLASQSEEADTTDGGVARWAVPGGAGPGRAWGGARRSRRSDRTAARRKHTRPSRSGAAAGPQGWRDHAGDREDFPPAPGRLGVGGR